MSGRTPWNDRSQWFVTSLTPWGNSTRQTGRNGEIRRHDWERPGEREREREREREQERVGGKMVIENREKKGERGEMEGEMRREG